MDKESRAAAAYQKWINEIERLTQQEIFYAGHAARAAVPDVCEDVCDNCGHQRIGDECASPHFTPASQVPRKICGQCEKVFETERCEYCTIEAIRARQVEQPSDDDLVEAARDWLLQNTALRGVPADSPVTEVYVAWLVQFAQQHAARADAPADVPVKCECGHLKNAHDVNGDLCWDGAFGTADKVCQCMKFTPAPTSPERRGEPPAANYATGKKPCRCKETCEGVTTFGDWYYCVAENKAVLKTECERIAAELREILDDSKDSGKTRALIYDYIDKLEGK